MSGPPGGRRRIIVADEDRAVEGVDGALLIQRLRKDRPEVPIIYLANAGRSTPEVEASLPSGVLIIREPFAAAKFRAAVKAKRDGKADGPAIVIRGPEH